MLTGPASALADVAVPVRAGKAAFLADDEMKTLRALVDTFIPGPPLDTDQGALAAGCAEAIDALLGAFKTDPPRIYAGAPFSDRGGFKVNRFKRFLRLDPYEEMGWRLRVAGSRGKKKLEFNGPVEGWQQTYREGLAALDDAAGGAGFAGANPIARELIVLNPPNGKVSALIDAAWPHTYQFMYGAPEYGGNKGLIGWDYTDYAGDVLPRGWTRDEIEKLDSAPSRQTDLSKLAAPAAAVHALAPLAAGEAAHHILARSGDSLAAVRAEIAAVLEWKGLGLLESAGVGQRKTNRGRPDGA